LAYLGDDIAQECIGVSRGQGNPLTATKLFNRYRQRSRQIIQQSNVRVGIARFP
jgi:hypothetical protein